MFQSSRCMCTRYLSLCGSFQTGKLDLLNNMTTNQFNGDTVNWTISCPRLGLNMISLHCITSINPVLGYQQEVFYFLKQIETKYLTPFILVQWVVGSILHGVDPLSYFSFQPVLHDWCNKGCGMCYPVCGMVHIKEPLLLIDKSSLCGGSGFPFSLSEWSLTICLTPYNRR